MKEKAVLVKELGSKGEAGRVVVGEKEVGGKLEKEKGCWEAGRRREEKR